MLVNYMDGIMLIGLDSRRWRVFKKCFRSIKKISGFKRVGKFYEDVGVSYISEVCSLLNYFYYLL